MQIATKYEFRIWLQMHRKWAEDKGSKDGQLSFFMTRDISDYLCSLLSFDTGVFERQYVDANASHLLSHIESTRISRFDHLFYWNHDRSFLLYIYVVEK